MNSRLVWVNRVGTISLFICIVFLSSYLFTYSVDLAHHYTLVDHLSKYLHIDNSFGNLGEMSFYPNLGHWIAVFVGSIFGSNILGVTVVTYISLVAIWLILFLLLFELSSYVAYTSALIIVFLGLMTGFFKAFFGFEVINSFFYAQFVAQSLVLGIIYIFYIFQDRVFKKHAIVALIFLPLLVSFVHVLPAMQLMVFAFVVVALDFWIKKKIIFSYLFFMAISVIVFVFHPSLSAMKEISQSNGELSFSFYSNFFLIAFIATLTIIMSLFFIFLRNVAIGSYALKIIAIFALSSAVLLVLQMIALQFGYGSDYAVKKHVFSVFTLFVIEISIACSFLLNFFVKIDNKPVYLKYFSAVAFSIFLIAIQVHSRVQEGVFMPVSELRNLESELSALRTHVISSKHLHKSVYLDKKPLISYLFSISILEHPRNETGMRLLFKNNILRDDVNVPSLVVIKSNYYNNQYVEKSINENKINIYSSYAFFQEMEKSNRDIVERVYSKDGLDIVEASFILKDGWNSMEAWGVWSGGKTAVIELDARASGYHDITVSLGMISWLKERNVKVSVNNSVCDQLNVAPIDKVYSLNCANVDLKDKIRVELDISDYDEAPKNFGLSDDTRTLGVGLKNIKIYKTNNVENK